jgi:hypothetical protein
MVYVQLLQVIRNMHFRFIQSVESMDGCKNQNKDCLQQSNLQDKGFISLVENILSTVKIQNWTSGLVFEHH